MEIISTSISIIAESPLWIPDKQELWWIDVNGKRLNRKSFLTDKELCYVLPQQPGCSFIDIEKRINVACEDGIYIFDENKGLLPHYSIIPKGNRFNDGKIGPDGSLWIGTISSKFDGALYKIEPNGTYRVLLEGMGNSNGLDWDLKRKKFFLNDTYKQKTYVFDFDDNYELHNQIVLRDWKTQNPDGMCIDAEGNLYVALFGDGKVVKISGTTGKILREIELPVPNVTSVCFSNKKHDELIVTTAAYNTDLKKYPLAGSVLRIKI